MIHSAPLVEDEAAEASLAGGNICGNDGSSVAVHPLKAPLRCEPEESRQPSASRGCAKTHEKADAPRDSSKTRVGEGADTQGNQNTACEPVGKGWVVQRQIHGFSTEVKNMRVAVDRGRGLVHNQSTAREFPTGPGDPRPWNSSARATNHEGGVQTSPRVNSSGRTSETNAEWVTGTGTVTSASGDREVSVGHGGVCGWEQRRPSGDSRVTVRVSAVRRDDNTVRRANLEGISASSAETSGAYDLEDNKNLILARIRDNGTERGFSCVDGGRGESNSTVEHGETKAREERRDVGKEPGPVTNACCSRSIVSNECVQPCSPPSSATRWLQLEGSIPMLNEPFSREEARKLLSGSTSPRTSTWKETDVSVDGAKEMREPLSRASQDRGQSGTNDGQQYSCDRGPGSPDRRDDTKPPSHVGGTPRNRESEGASSMRQVPESAGKVCSTKPSGTTVHARDDVSLAGGNMGSRGMDMVRGAQTRGCDAPNETSSNSQARAADDTRGEGNFQSASTMAKVATMSSSLLGSEGTAEASYNRAALGGGNGSELKRDSICMDRRSPGIDRESSEEATEEALAVVPGAFKATSPNHLPLGNELEQGGNGEASSGSESMVDVHFSSSGEKLYSLKPGPPRRGKWSRLEEEYAKRIINDFDEGLLDVEPGTGLRQLLASKLRCEVMRVSKKFCGWAAVGKRAFRPGQNLNGNATRARSSLFALEQRWLKTLLPCPATSCSTFPMSSTSPSGSGGSRGLTRLIPLPPSVSLNTEIKTLPGNSSPTVAWLPRGESVLAANTSDESRETSRVEGHRHVGRTEEAHHSHGHAMPMPKEAQHPKSRTRDRPSQMAEIDGRGSILPDTNSGSQSMRPERRGGKVWDPSAPRGRSGGVDDDKEQQRYEMFDSSMHRMMIGPTIPPSRGDSRERESERKSELRAQRCQSPSSQRWSLATGREDSHGREVNRDAQGRYEKPSCQEAIEQPLPVRAHKWPRGGSNVTSNDSRRWTTGHGHDYKGKTGHDGERVSQPRSDHDRCVDGGDSEPLYPVYSRNKRYGSASPPPVEGRGAIEEHDTSTPSRFLATSPRDGGSSRPLKRPHSPCTISRCDRPQGHPEDSGHYGFVGEVHTSGAQGRDRRAYSTPSSPGATSQARCLEHPPERCIRDRSQGLSGFHLRHNGAARDTGQGQDLRPAVRRFRLKHPPCFPPHLRVDHDSSAFFPGDSRLAPARKGRTDGPPPSTRPRVSRHPAEGLDRRTGLEEKERCDADGAGYRYRWSEEYMGSTRCMNSMGSFNDPNYFRSGSRAPQSKEFSVGARIKSEPRQPQGEHEKREEHEKHDDERPAASHHVQSSRTSNRSGGTLVVPPGGEIVIPTEGHVVLRVGARSS